MRVDNWEDDLSSRAKEKDSERLPENSPRKPEVPVKMSLARQQIRLKSNHTFTRFFFSNLLFSLGLRVTVMYKTFRWGEKRRKRGRQEGGSERVFLLANSAETGLPAPEREWSGGDSMPWESEVPVPVQEGDRGGLFSETERDFDGDVRNEASAF